MSDLSRLREQVCTYAARLYKQGLTHGSTGNISVRTPDGGLLVTPTGASFMTLDPARLSLFNAGMCHVDGDKPTKEMPLHSAFYETRSKAGAIVHLHSCHSVALSMMPDANEDDFLPPLTPYPIMKLGRVKLLPYFLPGDPAIGDAIRGLAGQRSAVMLGQPRPCCCGQESGSGGPRHRRARSRCEAGNDDPRPFAPAADR